MPAPVKKTVDALNCLGHENVRYYKFVYKGDGSCKICQQYNGMIFAEKDLPQTHPNCECARETTDSADIALGKFSPKQIYTVNGEVFNASRRFLEEKYGREIDDHSHSEPDCKLADNIERIGFTAALYQHFVARENKYSTPYQDNKKIPTVGIGANMTSEYVIQELLRQREISSEDVKQLRRYNRMNKNEKEKTYQQLQKIKLTERQIQSLFVLTARIAESDAKAVLKKGKWVGKKDASGTAYMDWQENAEDGSTWRKMPDLVKAVCIDLSFHAGGPGFAKYKNFIKAVKAEDYRRAALELLDSKDFNENRIKNKKNGKMEDNGTARRRRDAAIELSELAEEMAARKDQRTLK